MIKKLTVIGNSYGLVIDRSILELLHITPETELELSTADAAQADAAAADAAQAGASRAALRLSQEAAVVARSSPRWRAAQPTEALHCSPPTWCSSSAAALPPRSPPRSPAPRCSPLAWCSSSAAAPPPRSARTLSSAAIASAGLVLELGFR
jgi:antitoxin component of MazEF toxin-antitoxin module